ncbi:hypothetical protein MSAN_00677900 [Mycena sanguinolenta]|uniref:Uncharacterized protein n=1 Tax=Mycena sanguinolenta TaxID=230812 RepID=A0A8H6Z5Z2_9AGAR|nr:hypothetical protein MSAN_00677900 [Mycena sanguinolenta]
MMAPKTNFINPSPLACFFRLQSHPNTYSQYHLVRVLSPTPTHTKCPPSPKHPSPSSRNPTHLPRPGPSLESCSLPSSRRWHAYTTCPPARLTRVLVSVLADVENAYLVGVENGNGVLSTDADDDVAERLAVLQLKVSTLRETSLRNSVPPLSACYDMFNICHSVAVLRCLAEVRGLRTQIEISNESRLRDITSASQPRCQCPLANRASISLRRRGSPRSL